MSCYRFFMDGVEVEEPQGFDGMAFKKERHAVYFGFLSPGIGYGEAGDLTFTDEISVGIARAAWKREAVEAQVSLDIRLDEQLVFSGNLDFAKAKVGSDYVSCSLKMQKSVRDFLTTATNTVTVTPSERVQLPSRPDNAIASHEIAPDFPQYSYKGADEKDLSHYPVWETVKTGTDVKNFGVVDEKTGLAWHAVPSPFRPDQTDLNASREEWRIAYNVTGFKETQVEDYQDITVRVVGMIHLQAYSVAGGSFQMVLEYDKGGSSYATNAGDVTSRVTVADLPLTQQLTEHIFFFDEIVTLQSVGAWLFYRGLSFRVLSDTPSTDFLFDYQADSFLSVEVFKPDAQQPVDPLFFEGEALIKDLLKRNTGLDAQVNLGLLEGEKLFITSGKNIRGLSSDFGVSFEQLFKGLDGLLCLGAEVSGNTMIIEPKPRMIGNAIAYPLGEVDELFEESSENWLFSRVKVGFSEWQAGSPFGLDEINSFREYATYIKAVEKELDIRSELIGSSYIIQEGRSRIGTDEAREDWSFDEKLFVVIAVFDAAIGGYRAKTGDDNATAVLNVKQAVNLSIRPTEAVRRWLPLLSASGQMTFSAGEGNYRAVLDGLAENRNFPPSTPLLSRRAIHINTKIEMDTYAGIGQTISVETEEGMREALVQSVSFRPSTSDSEAEIVAYLLL
ncbi:hypothetical protein BWI93_05385 [Siphonobacter sp. BAB-5385]|uniref:hypothetical protein n=1 Tax=Siphonobacter sp. BAB-5385 TaxID=1864822 RepID=UPI000B9E89C4|nr:hypothetical protein [Siphonobacter sp. BAB-5385]OZI09180.1 hypothetical protein BWI93_05385 [Siphonobacter sp. BAB-5385]